MGWLCVHMYIFKVKRFSLFYLVGRLVDLCAVIMLLFAVSLFFIPFFPFYSHSCYAFPPPSLYVRAIRNMNNRTRNDFTRQNEQELWMRYNEQRTECVCATKKIATRITFDMEKQQPQHLNWNMCEWVWMRMWMCSAN